MLLLQQRVKNVKFALTMSSTTFAAGIAYDNRNKRLFITGKCWPKMYEVKTEITKLQMSATEHLQVQQMCGVTL